jgi:hypothetical protein
MIECLHKISLQIWDIPGGFATLLGAFTTFIAGVCVLLGARLAWKSVQTQIHSSEKIEDARHQKEILAIVSGFTAEMLVYSRAIIQAASIWNQRAKENPDQLVRTNFPIFQDPLFYRASLIKIGLLPQPWVIAGIITFYINILELNDQSREALAGRPTVNATSESIAARLHIIAATLSQVLDGLNADKKFPIFAEIQINKLYMPDGCILSKAEFIPENLQDVLLRIAGIYSIPNSAVNK